MDSLIQKIVSLLQNSNGVMTYDDLLTHLDYQEIQSLPRAIKQGRAEGTLKRRMTRDTENKENVLTIELPSPEA